MVTAKQNNMKIEKSKMVGWYDAWVTIKGQLFVGSGKSHSEALVSCFEKIIWLTK